MMSMAVQPTISGVFKSSAYPFPNLSLKPFKARTFASPTPFSLFSFTQLKKARKFSRFVSSLESISDISFEDTDDVVDEVTADKQKLKVVVKPMDKPRIVLKFIWMKKNIGLSLNQVIRGHGTIPLSPYYFWPRKDAWEELKALLESRPWISHNQMIILLNQATDIINLWQERGDLAP
ncbi:hypothetical protein Cgig2_011936 [Carnegiea gigantea]|uniref:30S ribosomal protein 3, chloroplastic n=1 Tax=Carnegiea gigantea TaxID=171969 RepID=A0A9Q1JNL1_9CARY|nr:hypothetical protein Cgig2_011936 [Carnegiea gigantea]